MPNLTSNDPLVPAALILAANSISIATAQTTNPSEVLEGARHDRIEQDKRLDRDATNQKQRDKEIKARQEQAGRTSRLLFATCAVIPRCGARLPTYRDRLFVRRSSPN